MSLSTKNIKTESKVSKTLYPGNITARIYDIQLTPGFNADSYHLVLSLESAPMGGDFEGFFIDKDDQSKGRYDGQIGRIKYSQWAFEDKTLPSGVQINRDHSIIKALLIISKAANKLDEIHALTEETIEEYVKAASKFLVGDTYYEMCVAGKEYVDKNGYTQHDLFFPKSDGKISFISQEADDVLSFDSSKHIVSNTKKAPVVNNFEPEAEQNGFSFD
jgi:hypothetical protein